MINITIYLKYISKYITSILTRIKIILKEKLKITKTKKKFKVLKRQHLKN